MENLNAEQIIKALECCVNHMCNECPLRDGRCANGEMGRLALALIKELIEENERLRADTVRKMQERLKEKAYIQKPYGASKVVDEYDIDQIANELLEGEGK